MEGVSSVSRKSCNFKSFPTKTRRTCFNVFPDESSYYWFYGFLLMESNGSFQDPGLHISTKFYETLVTPFRTIQLTFQPTNRNRT